MCGSVGSAFVSENEPVKYSYGTFAVYNEIETPSSCLEKIIINISLLNNSLVLMRDIIIIMNNEINKIPENKRI